ncbi:uncharacterized protein METZ01_LOCUS60020, partial [marine metagenome]
VPSAKLNGKIRPNRARWLQVYQRDEIIICPVKRLSKRRGASIGLPLAMDCVAFERLAAGHGQR